MGRKEGKVLFKESSPEEKEAPVRRNVYLSRGRGLVRRDGVKEGLQLIQKRVLCKEK